MSRATLEQAFAQWLKTRPQAVQDFAARYPLLPGDTVEHQGKTWWFMGYGQYKDNGGVTVGMIVTPIDPIEYYDGAVAARRYICPEHFD